MSTAVHPNFLWQYNASSGRLGSLMIHSSVVGGKKPSDQDEFTSFRGPVGRDSADGARQTLTDLTTGNACCNIEIGRRRQGVKPGRQNYADPASAESAAPARQMSTDVSPSRQGGWTGSGNTVIGYQLCSEFLSPADEEILKIVLGHVLSGIKERVTVATPGKILVSVQSWGLSSIITKVVYNRIKTRLSSILQTAATKVHLWCLTIPLPGIAPLVVAAMPIHDFMSADDLLGPLLKFVFGLLDRNIRVTLYACDGTETERSLQ
ncbi:hypothetical protein B0H13DRAFT_1864644 [Mycena leptocephala]|nr:hypothetical protein B0H13DRAFT_1864644 [Mycena leptocephala]